MLLKATEVNCNCDSGFRAANTLQVLVGDAHNIFLNCHRAVFQLTSKACIVLQIRPLFQERSCHMFLLAGQDDLYLPDWQVIPTRAVHCIFPGT